MFLSGLRALAPRRADGVPGQDRPGAGAEALGDAQVEGAYSRDGVSGGQEVREAEGSTESKPYGNHRGASTDNPKWRFKIPTTSLIAFG